MVLYHTAYFFITWVNILKIINYHHIMMKIILKQKVKRRNLKKMKLNQLKRSQKDEKMIFKVI